MGYSCNVQAAYVTDAWQQACIDQTGSQNVFRVKGQRYFWEIGREQRDGAITGTVWRFLENDRCQR